MKNILKHYAISLTMILILSTSIKAQKESPFDTNKHAKEELKEEKKIEKEKRKREKAEIKKDKKETNKLAKDKKFLKRREKRFPKPEYKAEKKTQ